MSAILSVHIFYLIQFKLHQARTLPSWHRHWRYTDLTLTYIHSNGAQDALENRTITVESWKSLTFLIGEDVENECKARYGSPPSRHQIVYSADVPSPKNWTGSLDHKVTLQHYSYNSPRFEVVVSRQDLSR